MDYLEKIRHENKQLNCIITQAENKNSHEERIEMLFKINITQLQKLSEKLEFLITLNKKGK